MRHVCRGWLISMNVEYYDQPDNIKCRFIPLDCQAAVKTLKLISSDHLKVAEGITSQSNIIATLSVFQFSAKLHWNIHIAPSLDVWCKLDIQNLIHTFFIYDYYLDTNHATE